MSALRTTLAELPSLVGRELGPAAPRVLGQAEVDAFAALTGDHQWIHVDTDRAAAHGGTIVHGLFLVSLIGGFWGDVIEVVDANDALNYGLDRVRFLSPVTVGSALTLRATVADAVWRGDGVKASLDVLISADGASGPAVAATSIVLFRP